MTGITVSPFPDGFSGPAKDDTAYSFLTWHGACSFGPTDADPIVRALAGEIHHMVRLKEILVATDFSEPSGAALAYGRNLARGSALTYACCMSLTTCWPRWWLVPGGYIASSLPEMQHDVDEDARHRLHALLSDEDRRELGARAVLLRSSAPAVAIVAYAKGSGVDLLVMGTRGRSGLEALVMGSVAEKVVRTAPCPVLTVRHSEHEFVEHDALVAVARWSQGSPCVVSRLAIPTRSRRVREMC